MAVDRRPINDVVTDIPGTQVSFDVDAFDEAILTQGVSLVHYAAMRCPVGMTDLDDNRRPHPDHESCTNGFLYTKVGTIHGLVSNNSKHKNPSEMGFWDGSTVQCTFTREYDDPQNIGLIVAPFDRFYLNEPTLVVPTWQLYISHASGMDRLKYPVHKVLDIADNTGIHYRESDDFVIANGQIKWIGSKRPAPNLDGDRGAIMSVRYTYRPYWYVGQVVHELRVSQVSVDGFDRGIRRMPQAVVLHREYVALTKDQPETGAPSHTGLDADAMRTIMSSVNGGFGAR
jgi:hypothetical protein